VPIHKTEIVKNASFMDGNQLTSFRIYGTDLPNSALVKVTQPRNKLLGRFDVI
jgi:hypothetical protein